MGYPSEASEERFRSAQPRRDRHTVIETISKAYGPRWLQGYVRGKLRWDAAYEEIAALFESTSRPILDVGCGVGILPMFLAQRGIGSSVLGIDSDARKIENARQVGHRFGLRARFEVIDARDPLPFSGHVVLLDVLHYLPQEGQQALLQRSAEWTSSGDLLVIRQCMNTDSIRFTLNRLQERVIAFINWIPSKPKHYPTPEALCSIVHSLDFETVEIRPLWGRTPFNNYLLVFRRR
jgi:2-polyprenyl-3-methyl-5-hydroxy-6-metoxy-1,4-benzoquinol methylase